MKTGGTYIVWLRATFILVLALVSQPNQRAEAAPEPAGWYSGDIHAHRSCGGTPESVSSIYNAMLSQNLAVTSLLADMGNGEVQNPTTDLPLVNGTDASISTAGHLLHWDAEWHWDATYTQYPHQALGGHIVALGLSQASQVWQEYTYPIFQWAHQRNGIAGFAHLQYLDNNIPQTLNCCIPIEYPVEVALGSCDFVSEDVTGGDPAMQAYFRLLNCGFRPGFAGGSDHPCGASVGSVVTYVQLSGGLTYRAWINGIAAGRTVVSRNGHNEFLDLKVNTSNSPGDQINLSTPGIVQASVKWTAIDNLSGSIELVQNGVVVASKNASVTPSTSASLTATVPFSKSGWLVARVMRNGEHSVLTGAVFVVVNNAPIRTSVDDANFYVAWMDNLLTKTSKGGEWNSFFPTSLAAAQARYQAARNLYAQIATEAAQGPLSISTTTLPDGAINVSYSASLAATGGTTPYTWSITSGTLPTGLSLKSTTGVISGVPTATGTFNFTARATDSSNPVQTASVPLSIAINTTQEFSLWPNTATPTTVDGGPDSAVELGVKFRSDTAGYIAGIRFYKASTNTGTHVGNLWNSSGTLLASGTFTGESASGWQQMKFSSPAAINANTTYVASYHANSGHYSADTNYFAATGLDNPPLHALADGASGGDGVYRYGTTSTFPNQTWYSCNYWVDVLFRATAAPSLSSISIVPSSATVTTGSSQRFTATGRYSDGSTQDLTTQATWASSNTAVATINSSGVASALTAGTTAISASSASVSATATLVVQAAPLAITTSTLPNGTVNTSYSTTLAATGGTPPYSWAITTGSLPSGLALNAGTGVISGTPVSSGTFNFTAQVTDHSNSTQTAIKNLGIVIAASQPTVTIWPATATPNTPDGGPDSSVELGVKFRSDVAGYITGIRFYKASTNTGTHVGALWSSSGQKLASASFSGETASGWQQVNFSTPVAISANTVYIASYHAKSGHYSADVNYFASSGIDTPPLHALANGVSGGNGVYTYGSTTIFPTSTWFSANYWVDVVFRPAN